MESSGQVDDEQTNISGGQSNVPMTRRATPDLHGP